MPQKPILLPVKVDPVGNGYYITPHNVTNLSTNVEELKYYIKKLEMLLEEIAEQHYLYLEDNQPSE